MSLESARSAPVGVTSKNVTKVGKSTANGVSKHGNRSVSSVCCILFHSSVNYSFCSFGFLTIHVIIKRAGPTKGTKAEPISVQDIAVQTQALLNIKDSNKVLLAEVGLPNIA